MTPLLLLLRLIGVQTKDGSHWAPQQQRFAQLHVAAVVMTATHPHRRR
jgi:hypothetical protein